MGPAFESLQSDSNSMISRLKPVCNRSLCQGKHQYQSGNAGTDHQSVPTRIPYELPNRLIEIDR